MRLLRTNHKTYEVSQLENMADVSVQAYMSHHEKRIQTDKNNQGPDADCIQLETLSMKIPLFIRKKDGRHKDMISDKKAKYRLEKPLFWRFFYERHFLEVKFDRNGKSGMRMRSKEIIRGNENRKED